MHTAAALVAAFVLAIGAADCFASRSIQLSPTEGELRRVTATSRALTLTEPMRNFNVICNVALTLSLNRSTAKAPGAELGLVTEGRAQECTGGAVRISSLSLPWSVSYSIFAGSLPNIASIQFRITGWSFLLEVFFGIARCLFGGAAIESRTEGNPLSSFRTLAFQELPLAAFLGSEFCPTAATVVGTFTLRPTLRMTLV